MSKDNAGVSQKQVPQNPTVLIRYEPENALAQMASTATYALAKIREAKITNTKELQSASGLLDAAEVHAEAIEKFKATLRERVQEAAARFREIKGFEDFEVTLTIRKWGLNQMLTDGIRNLKNLRARFLADEQEKLRRKQLEAQAEQDRINRKAADDAAKAAKAAGADKETVQEIKREVLATPAPIVQSKAATIAESVGAGLRFNYSAKITNIEAFLNFCLNNSVMLGTLQSAIPDMEKAFRKMAGDQKEKFKYPGIEYVKTPVDVAKGGRW